MSTPSRVPESIHAENVAPCRKCGSTAAAPGINRALKLAIYRCHCGFQWTVDLAVPR